ncbi:hypothetical protein H4Q26_000231 [Puccinia striiformis f. sp. tritici PST-130]|nr:hypothetical protein H4Q26_000231 [Puccinia striiformis f. sp. tritici PST-130]
MGAHLRNGRDISVEQRQGDIKRLKHGGQRGKKQYRLSPAATERARKLGKASGRAVPELGADGDGQQLPESQPGHRSLASGSQQPRNLSSHRDSRDNRVTLPEQYPGESDDGREDEGNKAQHTPTPNPSVQNRKREQNVQINQFVDQDNVTELLTVFDQQFNMFVCAHKARDDVMIRGILNSAIHTQSMIRQLAPEDWMRRCQDWIPRDDLEEWNQEVAEKRSQRTQTSPPQSRQSSMTPVPRQHNKRPNQQRIITEPRDLSLVPVHRPQPRQGTVYQDHGLGQNQGFHPGPPPPQQQHFMNEPQRAGFQEHHQAHHQQPLPFKGDHRHQRHFEQGFQGEFQEPHPPQAHQPPHHHHPYARGAGAWRGSRRNWRNNSIR